MRNQLPLPMNPQGQVCPKAGCGASGRIGVHSHQERRYKCHVCGGTFSERVNTPLYGLKHPVELVVLVLTLLAYGCPVVAIVKAMALDERTVRLWLERAGEHGQAIQAALLSRGDLPLVQVQSDEIRVVRRAGVAWMATAMEVFSRFFLWGEVAPRRDEGLIRRLVAAVKRGAGAQPRALLWCCDGLGSYATAIKRCFITRERSGRRGRPRHRLWPELHLVQLIKSSLPHVGAPTHRLVCGRWQGVQAMLLASQLFSAKVNTAFIERLNATFRERLPSLVRRKRAPAHLTTRLTHEMFWCGTVYNFVDLHRAVDGTPAMALGITQHPWSVERLLRTSPPYFLLHDSL